eukprot:COSAG06_NODE_576_length_14051_cov_5.354644_5_plen_143_part_00
MYGSQATYNSNAYAMLPVEPAPYLTTTDDTRAAQSEDDALGISMGKIKKTDVSEEFTVGEVAAQTEGNAVLPGCGRSLPFTDEVPPSRQRCHRNREALRFDRRPRGPQNPATRSVGRWREVAHIFQVDPLLASVGSTYPPRQ